MNTYSIPRQPIALGGAVPSTRVARLGPMLLAQIRAQVRIFLRLPAVSASALLMPLMLFGFFVLPHAREPFTGSVSVGAYMLASIGAYAVGSVMVFNFGVTVALDRGQKVDVLMRAAPLPGWVYMVARFATAMLFGVAALGLLFGVAASVGRIELDLATWLSLGARLLMGAAPFVALGFAIAYLAGPSAAPAVANLLFIGMAFASGMLVPLDQLPGTVRSVAPLLPTYHYTELAWGALGVAQDSTLVSAVWLIGFALGLFGLATFAYRRETRRAFA